MTSNRPLRFAAALSVEPDSAKAERQCLDRLTTELDGARPDLVAVFVSHHHGASIEELGPRIARALGTNAIVGCTGESIIGGTREVEAEPALSLWAASLPDTRVTTFECTAEPHEDERPTFSALPPIGVPSQSSVLLFADPFSFPADDYLRVMNDRFPGVPVVGGMASGGMGPGQNLLITADGLRAGGAFGVVLEGGVEVRSVVSQGCRPVGKPWVVTASHENLVQKLGGRAAVEVLAETLQNLPTRDRQLFQRQPFVGLAIDPAKSTFERGDFLVRQIVGVQPQEKAIAVSDVPRRGSTLQFLVRDADSASEDLAALMSSQGGGSVEGDAHEAGALLFSCNGRGSRMFTTRDHDVTKVRGGLHADLPIAGFFAMGEIGPVGKRNFLHAYTASVAVFRARRS
ncbi:MAG: FIST C-terminal domain-containing protein [Planctomycetes bacterium]|nr:FIST C-terminal domain-containing protein [Planctomycetota bacterium]